MSKRQCYGYSTDPGGNLIINPESEKLISFMKLPTSFQTVQPRNNTTFWVLYLVWAITQSALKKNALGKDCHDQQDYHTTQADYLKLVEKKEHLLKLTDFHEATLTMGLELEIADIVKRFALCVKTKWPA